MEDASLKIPEGSKRIIICEGPHDKHFLEALITRRSLPDYLVLDAHTCCGKGGKDGLVPALLGLSPLTGFGELTGVAIITDNDDMNSLISLESKLNELDDYERTGTRIGKMTNIPVGIILIPDNNNHGELETLCLPALYEKWPKAEECVRAYLECTGANTWEKQNELCKATVRSIISGFYENDPYKGLGYLFKEVHSLSSHPCFNELSDILSRFDEIVGRGSF